MAIQYTIRNIPPEVDNALKQKAKLLNKSFNQIVVDQLSGSVVNLKGTNDFNWFFGSMKPDKAFDDAIADLSKVDEEFFNDPSSIRH